MSFSADDFFSDYLLLETVFACKLVNILFSSQVVLNGRGAWSRSSDSYKDLDVIMRHGIHIRRATVDDKEAVLSIRDQVSEGRDYLPTFYDILIKSTNTTSFVVVYERKIVSTITLIYRMHKSVKQAGITKDKIYVRRAKCLDLYKQGGHLTKR